MRGGHANSGRKPDPNAFRRDRSDDASWVTLPREGYRGSVPDFPLPDALASEVELWAKLWAKPQGFMWAQLGLELEVAAYVRAFLESVQERASAGLKTAVLRMAAEIGLSVPGMNQFRWKFSEDELSAKRQEFDEQEQAGPSVRERLEALRNGS